MSKIGYIRVSTEHQETARQQEIMCDYQVDRISPRNCQERTQTTLSSGQVHRAKAYPHRLDEVRAALWGMEVEEYHWQGLYAKNRYVGKHLLPPRL